MDQLKDRLGSRIVEGLVVALIAAAASTIATTKVLEERMRYIETSMSRQEQKLEQLYRDVYRPYIPPRRGVDD